MTEVPPFPQNRTCPYDPPAGYRDFRNKRSATEARLYDGRPAWVVSDHSLARALLADGRLSVDRANDAFPIHDARFLDLPRRSVALVGVDDPEHNAQRRILIKSFSLKKATALRPMIQKTVDRLLDDMISLGDRADLVTAFALPVPSRVICSLLGVPYRDHEFFEEQSRRLLRGPLSTDVENARLGLESYLEELISKKRTQAGGDSLLDELIFERLNTGDLSVGELVDLVFILLVAGHETTANMISLAVFTLLTHPLQLAELRDNPDLLPAAVEELLRFLSIADGILRVATQDVEIADTAICKDDGVVFLTSLVNRDETLYPNPDVLDWHRSTRHHIAFGYGIHQCLGQNLARAEIEIALGTLIRRLPGLRLAIPPEEVPFKPGDTLQGLLELPVAW